MLRFHTQSQVTKYFCDNQTFTRIYCGISFQTRKLDPKYTKPIILRLNALLHDKLEYKIFT